MFKYVSVVEIFELNSYNEFLQNIQNIQLFLSYILVGIRCYLGHRCRCSSSSTSTRWYKCSCCLFDLCFTIPCFTLRLYRWLTFRKIPVLFVTIGIFVFTVIFRTFGLFCTIDLFRTIGLFIAFGLFILLNSTWKNCDANAFKPSK